MAVIECDKVRVRRRDVIGHMSGVAGRRVGKVFGP